MSVVVCVHVAVDEAPYRPEAPPLLGAPPLALSAAPSAAPAAPSAPIGLARATRYVLAGFVLAFVFLVAVGAALGG